jgi:hypothetical protein
MVEEDPVTCEKIVSLPVIDGHPVGIDFGGGIRASGIKRGSLALGRRAAPNISEEEA